MESADINSYAPPVDKLLTYGEAEAFSVGRWPNYLELGLEREDIPELIRMMADDDLNWADSDSLEVWAPIHAWRALGQLHAEAAIEPLLSLFEGLEESDWVSEEIPEVLGMIGPTALPALAEYIADDFSHDEYMRIDAISSVEKVGTHWPEARSACIDLLTKQLELFAEDDPGVNGFLVSGLVELKATEALPLIERAFAAKKVDETIQGDWEYIQVEFGLKSAEGAEAARQEKILPETPFPSPEQKIVVTPQVSSKERSQREATHKKAKSKMVNQSRKKNRKR